ncbi:unnamed protein product [Paramecium pentaurelia]|uniref:Uncharacterized protein n=1 Tax=Paramecium pentaurelia TaxID=43138 RepID=A0A8S1VW21_9CILI|nr:unnamed protein product [Paramecium pentaurelia]
MGNSQQKECQEEEQLAQHQKLKQKMLYRVIKSHERLLKNQVFCLGITFFLILLALMNSVLLLLYDDEN